LQGAGSIVNNGEIPAPIIDIDKNGGLTNSSLILHQALKNIDVTAETSAILAVLKMPQLSTQ
jgi:hypothetical protein